MACTGSTIMLAVVCAGCLLLTVLMGEGEVESREVEEDWRRKSST